MSTDDEEIERAIKLGLKEHQALHSGLVQITLSWSNLETSLALILREIVDHSGSGSVAFAIYYALASADARISVVDAAFRTVSEMSQHHSRIEKVWQRTLNSASRLKAVRNAAAHGQITTIARYGKNHVRLTPPTFDWRRIAPSLQKRQLPGFSAHDLKQSAQRMNEVSIHIDQYAKIVASLRRNDDATLLETLLQLEADQKISEPPKDDQNSQER